MKLKEYGFMVTLDNDDQTLTHLSSGLPQGGKVSLFYNGQKFLTLTENADNCFCRFHYEHPKLGTPVSLSGFFIEKNRMFHEQGRTEYILSYIKMQMINRSNLSDSLVKAYSEFVDKYFQYIHGAKRTEEEADALK